MKGKVNVTPSTKPSALILGHGIYTQSVCELLTFYLYGSSNITIWKWV